LDDATARRCFGQQKFGLRDRGCGLDEHGRVDAGASEPRDEIVECVVAMDRGQRRREPSVVAARQAPQMMMCVDANHVACGLSEGADVRHMQGQGIIAARHVIPSQE
jgi:hypothetical protein